jgi:chorismate mutase
VAEERDVKPAVPMPPEVDPWRERIDAIDDQILGLLNSRSACAVEIGRIKRRVGLPIYSPERERSILGRLAERNPGPLDGLAVKRVFERIIDESRRLERVTAEGEDADEGEPGDGAGTGRQEKED